MNTTIPELLTILLMILAAATAGLVGSFALMKRMTLAGDAISHIALPGLGIAILLKINPILGAAIALLIGALLIWKLEQQSGLSSETAVGVIFSASLALGALMLSNEDLIEALFGNFSAIGLGESLSYLVITAGIVSFLIIYRNQLVLSIFSNELARANGVNINKLNAYYLIAFVMTIVLGLRFLGALLVGSLIIIPAATSRQLTHNLKFFLFYTSLLSCASVLIGFWLSRVYGVSLGPIVITISALFFIISLLVKKK